MKKLLLLVVVMCSGCSMMAVNNHNSRTERRAIELRLSNTEVGAAVDLMNLNTGYFAAWKERPLTMLGATIGDAGLAYGIYRLNEEIKDDSAPATPQTSGNVIYINDNTGKITILTGSSDENQLATDSQSSFDE